MDLDLFLQDIDALKRQQLGVDKQGPWANQWSSAIRNYGANLAETGAAVGLPTEDWAQQTRRDAGVYSQAAREGGIPQSWEEVDGVASGAKYVGQLATQSLPYIGEAVVGGLTGGTLLAPKLAQAGLTAQRAARIGRGIGVVGASYPSSVGDILSNQRDQSGTTDPASAFALGVPYAAANLLGLEGIAGRVVSPRMLQAGQQMTGLGGRALRGVTTGAVTAAGESLNETGQEGLNQLGRMAVDPTATFTDPEALGRYKEAAIGGALLGKTIGTGVGVLTGPKKEALPGANPPMPTATPPAPVVPQNQTSFDLPYALGQQPGGFGANPPGVMAPVVPTQAGFAPEPVSYQQQLFDAEDMPIAPRGLSSAPLVQGPFSSRQGAAPIEVEPTLAKQGTGGKRARRGQTAQGVPAPAVVPGASAVPAAKGAPAKKAVAPAAVSEDERVNVFMKYGEPADNINPKTQKPDGKKWLGKTWTDTASLNRVVDNLAKHDRGKSQATLSAEEKLAGTLEELRNNTQLPEDVRERDFSINANTFAPGTKHFAASLAAGAPDIETVVGRIQEALTREEAKGTAKANASRVDVYRGWLKRLGYEDVAKGVVSAPAAEAAAETPKAPLKDKPATKTSPAQTVQQQIDSEVREKNLDSLFATAFGADAELERALANGESATEVAKRFPKFARSTVSLRAQKWQDFEAWAKKNPEEAQKFQRGMLAAAKRMDLDEAQLLEMLQELNASNKTSSAEAAAAEGAETSEGYGTELDSAELRDDAEAGTTASMGEAGSKGQAYVGAGREAKNLSVEALQKRVKWAENTDDAGKVERLGTLLNQAWADEAAKGDKADKARLDALKGLSEQLDKIAKGFVRKEAGKAPKEKEATKKDMVEETAPAKAKTEEAPKEEAAPAAKPKRVVVRKAKATETVAASDQYAKYDGVAVSFTAKTPSGATAEVTLKDAGRELRKQQNVVDKFKELVNCLKG